MTGNPEDWAVNYMQFIRDLTPAEICQHYAEIEKLKAEVADWVRLYKQKKSADCRDYDPFD